MSSYQAVGAGHNQNLAEHWDIGERPCFRCGSWNIFQRLQSVTDVHYAGSPVFVVFMLPHNPALRTLPSGARDMTDHQSFRKLEQSVRGCTEWYFWHMSATQQQEDRLQVCKR